MDLNAAGGSKAGASDEQIQALADYRNSDLFNDKEKLAFELADASIQVPVDVADELFTRLQQHYSNEELVELAAICALENFRSRFNRIFQVEANGVYCPVPMPQTKA